MGEHFDESVTSQMGKFFDEDAIRAGANPDAAE